MYKVVNPGLEKGSSVELVIQVRKSTLLWTAKEFGNYAMKQGRVLYDCYFAKVCSDRDISMLTIPLYSLF